MDVLLLTVLEGTHMSLIQLSSGKFLVIDAVPLTEQMKTEIDEFTDNGEKIEAVILTHPFHTLAIPAFYKAYPKPPYYGCPRHLRNFPDIKWAGDLDDCKVRSKWSPEVELSIPAGSFASCDSSSSTSCFMLIDFFFLWKSFDPLWRSRICCTTSREDKSLFMRVCVSQGKWNLACGWHHRVLWEPRILAQIGRLQAGHHVLTLHHQRTRALASPWCSDSIQNLDAEYYQRLELWQHLLCTFWSENWWRQRATDKGYEGHRTFVWKPCSEEKRSILQTRRNTHYNCQWKWMWMNCMYHVISF